MILRSKLTRAEAYDQDGRFDMLAATYLRCLDSLCSHVYPKLKAVSSVPEPTGELKSLSANELQITMIQQIAYGLGYRFEPLGEEQDYLGAEPARVLREPANGSASEN